MSGQALRHPLLALAAFLGFVVQRPAPSRAVPAPGQVVPWQEHFQAVAGERWVDRAAQVQAESGWNANAVSPVGAEGPAQFMPATWRWVQSMGWVPRGSSPRDPAAAIAAQHRYMSWLEVRVGGRLDPALGAYNAGLGSIRRAQLLATQFGLEDLDGNAWLRTLPRVTGPAHAAETQGYIRHNRVNRAAIHSRLGDLDPDA